MTLFTSSKATFIGFFLAAILLVSSIAHAQHFEGVLVVKGFDKDDSKETTFFIKEGRLGIQGNVPNSPQLGPMNSSDGFLLRADERDLILLSDDKTAVQIKIQDLESLLNMFGGAQQTQVKVDETISYERTDNRRSIHGYRAYQTIVRDSKKPDIETHVWSTKELKIDWSSLFSAFGSLGSQIGIDNLDTAYGWDMNTTPLLFQTFNKGNLRNSVEVISVDSRKLNTNEIDIPKGYELMTFFQMMMRQSQRQR